MIAEIMIDNQTIKLHLQQPDYSWQRLLLTIPLHHHQRRPAQKVFHQHRTLMSRKKEIKYYVILFMQLTLILGVDLIL